MAMKRWPLANDDFAHRPLSVHLLSRAIVHVQEENLRQAGDEDVAAFIRDRALLNLTTFGASTRPLAH